MQKKNKKGTEEEEEMFKKEYKDEISEKGSILLKTFIDMKNFLKKVENFKKYVLNLKLLMVIQMII